MFIYSPYKGFYLNNTHNVRQMKKYMWKIKDAQELPTQTDSSEN